MGSNGTSRETADLLTDLTAPLRAHADQLRAQRTELATSVTEIDVELRRIDRVLKAAEPEKPAKLKPPKKKVAEDKVTRVWNVLENEHKGEEFTSAMVAEWTGISESSVKLAISTLRDREFVRLTGRADPEPGKKGLTPYKYRLMSDVGPAQ
jgi:hypothetical protein